MRNFRIRKPYGMTRGFLLGLFACRQSVFGVEPDDAYPFPQGLPDLAERHVVDAEYFVETDPGEGSAQSLSAEDSDFNDSTEQLSKFTLKMDDLAGGNRRLGMRVKDNQGNWSNINYLEVCVLDLATVNADDFGEGQIDRVTVGSLPEIGSKVTVQVDDQNYS